MKFKISFTLSIVALAALLVVACSTDESISPSGEVSTETDEQGYLKNIVPAEGGTVNITFSTNCDWKALCYDSDFHVTIMPVNDVLFFQRIGQGCPSLSVHRIFQQGTVKIIHIIFRISSL